MLSKDMSRKSENSVTKLNPNCCVNINQKGDDTRDVHQKHECNILTFITTTGKEHNP
jgi:hypothetical protein